MLIVTFFVKLGRVREKHHVLVRLLSSLLRPESMK